MSRKFLVSLIVVVLVLVQIISSYLSYQTPYLKNEIEYEIRNEIEDEIESEIEYFIYSANGDRVDSTVSVEVVEKTQQFMTVIFHNNTNNEYMFGNRFKLEKRAENGWENVDTIIDNFAFADIGLLLHPNGTREHDFNWEWLHGTLESGEYRIITGFSHLRDSDSRSIGTYYITINFTL